MIRSGRIFELGVGYAGVVYCAEALLEGVFDDLYVAEGYGAFVEEAILYLGVDDFVDEVVDSLGGIVGEAS